MGAGFCAFTNLAVAREVFLDSVRLFETASEGFRKIPSVSLFGRKCEREIRIADARCNIVSDSGSTEAEGAFSAGIKGGMRPLQFVAA
jgi:hypothetical protein